MITPKSKLEAAYNGLKYINKVTTQKDFGDKLGYHKSYFSQLMNGALPITEAVKQKCYDTLKISKQWWDTDFAQTLQCICPGHRYTRPASACAGTRQCI